MKLELTRWSLYTPSKTPDRPGPVINGAGGDEQEGRGEEGRGQGHANTHRDYSSCDNFKIE